MKEENMPVLDFSELPEPDSEAFIWMPEDDFEQYEIYCEYIQLGTSVPSGSKIESGFYCRQEMEDGELCDGTIDVTQIDLPGQIRWECRKCADKGAIINFEGTIWDNSGLTETEKEIFLEGFFSDISGEVFLGDDEFFDFFEEESSGPFDDFDYYLNPYDLDGKQAGGLASSQIEELLQSDWMNPDTPVYLKDDLPLEELEKSFFFYNARQFLIRLKEDESFPLTRSENLKRKVVRKLVGQSRWPDNYIEYISEYKKTLDETDVWLLHGTRILLELAGLIEQDEDRIRLNEKRLHLLEEANAGELYRLLFSTYFKEMNMSYIGSTIELPHLQYSVPFILYKLQRLAKDWVPVEELLPEILLNSVRLELQYEDVEGTGLANDLLYEDLFSSLNRFGLLDTRKSADTNEHDYPDQIRITPLFEKFISLNVD